MFVFSYIYHILYSNLFRVHSICPNVFRIVRHTLRAPSRASWSEPQVAIVRNRTGSPIKLCIPAKMYPTLCPANMFRFPL